MSFIRVLLICLVSVGAFAATPDLGDNIYETERQHFIALVEQSLVLRSEVLGMYPELEKAIKGEEAIPQRLQNAIIDKTRDYVALRKDMLDFIQAYNMLAVVDDVETGLSKKTGTYKGSWLWKDSILYINPTDSLGQEYILRMKAGLAMAMVLFDNYLIMVKPVFDTPVLRRKIDQDHSQLNNTLEEITDSYLSWENRDMISLALQMFLEEEEFMLTLEDNKHITDDQRQTLIELRSDKDRQYLDTVIGQSPSFKDLRKNDVLDTYKKRALKRHKERLDLLVRIKGAFTNTVSKGFGNAVGLYEARKGYLYSEDIVSRSIEAQLEPLDIVLEKTPFRLTDKFIPGHWGHAAIWIGSPQQLSDIRLENGTSVLDSLRQGIDARTRQPIRYSEAILRDLESGKMMLEALRPGVMLNTIDHFLNVDDIGVMRRSERHALTQEQKYEFLMLAFQQYGKKYDFNFDVNTDETIVCSELVYKVYPEDNWPTENTVNRWTISPDNVAQRSVDLMEDGSYIYDVPLLYSRGQVVTRSWNDNRDFMKQLLECSYECQ